MSNKTNWEGRWDDRLQCYVVSLTYDFTTKAGTLVIARDSCCDMRGCIAMFTAIDSEVKLIRTYQGTRRDTIYRKATDWVVE